MVYTREQLLELKRVMNCLSEGTDPTCGLSFPKDTVLNSCEIQEHFVNVMELLEFILRHNTYTIHGDRKHLIVFHLNPEETEIIKPIEEEVSVSRFTHYLNDIKACVGMRKLQATQITEWLIDNGFLEYFNNKDGNYYKIASSKGTELGISTVRKVNSIGEEYATNYYNSQAQKFIIKNINRITGFAK